MMLIKKNLHKKRILSIDAFRGITIFIMIFVNELSAVSNVPQWLKHMPAEADAMTFVDIIFPAFLFIVGMSVPFAFNARLIKGNSPQLIWKHTLKRSFALIIMGLFMVNAEYGFNESKMIISAALWGFIAYILPISIWNKYKDSFPKLWKNILIYGGLFCFVGLYFLYIQEGTGERGMTSKWWGILGLIGWAYLLTVIFYWLTNGKLAAMIVFFLISIAFNSISRVDNFVLNSFEIFNFINGHLIHASLVSAGVIISLLFFENKSKSKINWQVISFGILFVVMGYFLRPHFEVSKIRGTPSWTLYSAAICTAVYYLLYWLIEIKQKINWTDFFMPAASNPLLIYILPGIIYYFIKTLGLKILPEFMNDGIPGVIWSLIFSIIMLYLVKIFNKYNIRLNL